MLEIMSIVAVMALVALLSIIKHLRAVSHDMWVKMVDMEVEHFKGVLDSLHVDTKTILQNLES